MSDDPITFDRIGTVTILFDDGPVTLRRPTFKQWRWFNRGLQEITDTARAELKAITDRLAEAQAALDAAGSKAATAKAEKALEAVQAELAELNSTPYYERFLPWKLRLLEQMTDDAYPADPDDWPSWLVVDLTLPRQIVQHWETAPKASGPPPPN